MCCSVATWKTFIRRTYTIRHLKKENEGKNTMTMRVNKNKNNTIIPSTGIKLPTIKRSQPCTKILIWTENKKVEECLISARIQFWTSQIQRHSEKRHLQKKKNGRNTDGKAHLAGNWLLL